MERDLIFSKEVRERECSTYSPESSELSSFLVRLIPPRANNSSISVKGGESGLRAGGFDFLPFKFVAVAQSLSSRTLVTRGKRMEILFAV
jgi:hypothetical protein